MAATAILSYYSNSHSLPFIFWFIYHKQALKAAAPQKNLWWGNLYVPLLPLLPLLSLRTAAFYLDQIRGSGVTLPLMSFVNAAFIHKKIKLINSVWSKCVRTSWEVVTWYFFFYFLKRSSVNVFCPRMEQIADSFVHSADSNQPLSEKCLDVL